MGLGLSSIAKMTSETIPRIYCPPTPSSYVHTRDIVMVTTIDGHKIACRLFSPFASESDTFLDFKNRHRTVLFSHGNSDDIGTCSSYCQWMADSLACNVVAYDYLNYGVSDKVETSEQNMRHSIEAVFGYITSTLHVPKEDIFLLGKSLGSVPAVYIASQSYCNGVAGLILVSPMASGVRVVLKKTRFPARVMAVLDDCFGANIKLMSNVKRPILIVHGTMDTIIPVQNSHDLFDQITPGSDYPPLWVQAGHNDIECLHKGLFTQTLQSFIQHCTSQCGVDYT